MNGHQTPLDLLAFVASHGDGPDPDTGIENENQGNLNQSQTSINDNMPEHQNPHSGSRHSNPALISRNHNRTRVGNRLRHRGSRSDTRPNNETLGNGSYNQPRANNRPRSSSDPQRRNTWFVHVSNRTGHSHPYRLRDTSTADQILRQRLIRYTDMRRNTLLRHLENNGLGTGQGQIQSPTPSGDVNRNVSLPAAQDSTMDWVHGAVINRNGDGRAIFSEGRESNGDAPRSVPLASSITNRNGIDGNRIVGQGISIGGGSNGDAPRGILSTNVSVEMPVNQHPLIVRWASGLGRRETGQRPRLRSPQPLMLRFGDFPPALMSQGHETQSYTSGGSQSHTSGESQSPISSSLDSSPRRSPISSANDLEQDVEQCVENNIVVSFVFHYPLIQNPESHSWRSLEPAGCPSATKLSLANTFAEPVLQRGKRERQAIGKLADLYTYNWLPYLSQTTQSLSGDITEHSQEDSELPFREGENSGPLASFGSWHRPLGASMTQETTEDEGEAEESAEDGSVDEPEVGQHAGIGGQTGSINVTGTPSEDSLPETSIYTHRVGFNGSPLQRAGLFMRPTSILFGSLYTQLENDRSSVTATSTTAVAGQQSSLHPPLPPEAPSMIFRGIPPNEKDTDSDQNCELRGGSPPPEFVTQMNNESTPTPRIATVVLGLEPCVQPDSDPFLVKSKQINQELISTQTPVFQRTVPFDKWCIMCPIKIRKDFVKRKHVGKVSERVFLPQHTTW